MQTIEFHATIQNGQIKIPEEYRNSISSEVRVILIQEGIKEHDNFIDQLLNQPICLKDFHPMTREEIYAR